MRRLSIASNVARSRGWPFNVVAVVVIVGGLLMDFLLYRRRDGVGAKEGKNATGIFGVDDGLGCPMQQRW